MAPPEWPAAPMRAGSISDLSGPASSWVSTNEASAGWLSTSSTSNSAAPRLVFGYAGATITKPAPAQRRSSVSKSDGRPCSPWLNTMSGYLPAVFGYHAVVLRVRVPSRVKVSVRVATSNARDGARPAGIGAADGPPAPGAAVSGAARPTVAGPHPDSAKVAASRRAATIGTGIRTRTGPRLARPGEPARVPTMSDEYQDPSGNTQAFRAFAQSDEPEQSRSNLPLIIGGAVAVLVILLVVVLLFLG